MERLPQGEPRPPASAAPDQAGTAPHKVSPGWDFREGANSLLGDSNSLLGIKFGSQIPCKIA
jgi:hypothetical protein